MNRLDYKTGKIYVDGLIWDTINHQSYTKMFNYYLQCPLVSRDTIGRLDYIKGNKN